MAEFVKAKVYRQNTQTYNTPQERQIPCEAAEIGPMEYYNPIESNGTLIGYSPTQDVSKLQTDGFTGLRVRTLQNDLFVVVLPNGSTPETFTDECNACCGATPDLTSGATIPAFVSEQNVNPGSPNLYFSAPVNPFTRNLLISRITYNGGTVPFTPNSGGYANIAAVVTALNTGASAMGTWTSVNSGKTIQLVPANGVNTGGMDVNVLNASFCLDLPSSPGTIRYLTVKNDSNVDTNIDLGVLTFSEANRASILAAIQAAFPVGTWTAPAIGGTDYRIQYAGAGRPVSVKGTDGTTTVASFTSGVCA